MANAETRRQRHRTHVIFDRLWERKILPSRGRAYRWLRGVLCAIRRRQVTEQEAHIGQLGAEECLAVQVEAAKRLAMGRRKRKAPTQEAQ